MHHGPRTASYWNEGLTASNQGVHSLRDFETAGESCPTVFDPSDYQFHAFKAASRNGLHTERRSPKHREGVRRHDLKGSVM